ncbi:MAG: pirin family protein [Thermoanaerobacterales bacterium]|nr:pirin family protein [Thermoanaerobacterales bacterium]
MAARVLHTFPLSTPWQTLDPFLFVMHHRDAYPRGNAELGPDAPLAGRTLGNDFSGAGGWSMYHGTTVPGFPGHPHRGFETITYVRAGLVDHADSLGAAARYGRGDTQWLTAGAGVVHAEMFPLLERDRPNPLELFQIWLNLPAADKLAEPHFTMLWAEETPRLVTADEEGRTTEVVVIAGELAGHRPPPPPPRSWASRPEADVALWHLTLDAGARWTLPPAAGPATRRVLYVFAGSWLSVDGQEVGAGHGALVEPTAPLDLAGGDGGVQALLLQGRPIGEPVARYGPFVMNDEAGIRQAFADYRRTRFGGWPWDRDDPVHDPAEPRFARHADGRVDRRGRTPAPAPATPLPA